MSGLENFLNSTKLIVEATTFERHCLWEKYCNELEWVQELSGYLPTVGHIDGLPVVISLSWASVGGLWTLFWHPTSMVVDHRIIDMWFDSYLPEVKKIDANNFFPSLCK